MRANQRILHRITSEVTAFAKEPNQSLITNKINLTKAEDESIFSDDCRQKAAKVTYNSCEEKR